MFSIDYKINAKEAVWLVYQSWYTTLREQIDACRYIEENLPDMDLGDVYDGFIGTISFAKDLPDWMDVIVVRGMELYIPNWMQFALGD